MTTISHDNDLWAVCVHEAGHTTVAAHFGFEPDAFVGGGSAGVVMCGKRGTPIQNAAVSWGGVLAEEMLGARHSQRPVPSIPLTANKLPQFVAELESIRYRGLSAEDREGMLCHHPTIEGTKLSFEILSSSERQLRAEARILELLAKAEGCSELPEVQEFDVQMFMAEREAKAQRETQRENIRAIEQIEDLLVPGPNEYPVDWGDFLYLAAAGGTHPTKAHSDELDAYAADLRQRGGHAAFLSVKFNSRAEWLFFYHDFMRWRKQRQTQMTK